MPSLQSLRPQCLNEWCTIHQADHSHYVKTLTKPFLQRQTDPLIPCPKALWSHPFEQPHLPLQFRYAPPLSYPNSTHVHSSVLLWEAAVPLGATILPGLPTIVNILKAIRDNVLHHQECIEEPHQKKMQITLHVSQSLDWLSSKAVENWYTGLHDSHKCAFAALLRHLAHEASCIGARDGCYIAITYIVSIPLTFWGCIPQTDKVIFFLSMTSLA